MKRLGMFVLVAVLVLGIVAGVGCNFPSVKTTGGGWFTDGCGEGAHKVTFGFTAMPTDEGCSAKGQFQLVDHGDKPPTILHGEFDDVDWVNDLDYTRFYGKCTIKGEEGEFDLEVKFYDEGEPGPSAGDKIKVKIHGWDGGGWDYSGELEGGNVQFHVPQEYRDEL